MFKVIKVGIVTTPVIEEYVFETKEEARAKFIELNDAFSYGEDYQQVLEQNIIISNGEKQYVFYGYKNGDSAMVDYKKMDSSHFYYEDNLVVDIYVTEFEYIVTTKRKKGSN